jgi:hypothetical protein
MRTYEIRMSRRPDDSEWHWRVVLIDHGCSGEQVIRDGSEPMLEQAGGRAKAAMHDLLTNDDADKSSMHAMYKCAECCDPLYDD